jgi:hypothetical protein
LFGLHPFLAEDVLQLETDAPLGLGSGLALPVDIVAVAADVVVVDTDETWLLYVGLF